MKKMNICLNVFNAPLEELFTFIVNDAKLGSRNFQVEKYHSNDIFFDEIFLKKKDKNKNMSLFWQNNFEKRTYMYNTYDDGWFTLGNYLLSKLIITEYYQFYISNEIGNDCCKNGFYYKNYKNEERVVYSSKDDHWVFYEKGKLMDFEIIENYKKRIIKDRVNEHLIKRYLEYINIDLNTIFSADSAGFALIER